MSADRRRDKVAPSRPLQPRLAATATSRSGPASTPRLAAHYVSPTPPGVRRPPSALGVDHSSPLLAENKSSRDASPNITPRSAARRTRPETAMATPGSTGSDRPYARARAQSAVPSTISEKIDTNMTRLQAEEWKRRHLSPAPSSVSVSHTPDSSNFFYANDTSPEHTTTRPPLQTKTSTFIYANGAEDGRTPPQRKPEVVIPGSTPENPTHAALSPSPLMPPPSHVPSLFRPASPPKDSLHLTYRKGASQILRPGNQGPISPPAVAHTRNLSDEWKNRRRSSIDGVDPEGRKQSPGMSSNGSSVPTSPPNTSHRMGRSSSGSSGKGAVTSPNIPVLRSPLPEHASIYPPRMVSPERRAADAVHSPGSNPNDSVASDLAVNARRERKVLDLEISNSSLLAINRSLEREVRKQKAELRRMRRMSRNSNRSISWQTDVSAASKLSALTEYEDDGSHTPGEGDLEDLSDEESLDEENMSVSALAEHDARHSENDARRIKLDLKRHREVLVDSQKLNQSIKRCLGVTEQLIRDGTKALEYQVRLNEVELGGRVLSPEEIEEREQEAPTHGQDSYFDEWDHSTRTASGTLTVPTKMDASGATTPDSIDVFSVAEYPTGLRQVSATTTTTQMMKEMF